MKVITGNIDCKNSKIAIVISRFNKFINQNLLEGTLDILQRIGNVKKENITIVWAPGALELPILINILAKSKKYEAIIALGTIIKGDTNHYNLISKECSSKISSISLKYSIPITSGILSVDNINQAFKRSGIKINNYGEKAALTALEMINILNTIISL